MKTKTILLTLGTALLFTPSVYAETSGKALFDAKCASCHVTMRPDNTSKLMAPPAMGVMRHVKMTYATKEAAVKFITEYALNPDESKAVCMAEKIKRFGLMPSQKGNVTKEELTTIASWMYDNFGSRGQGGKHEGQGQGSGNGERHGKNCKNK